MHSFSEENEEPLSYLRKQIASSLVVPFVGAGLAAPFGYPTWTDFLKQQAHTAGCSDEIETLLRSSKYEDAAQRLEDFKSRPGLNEAIRKTFGRTNPQSPRDSAMAALAKIFRGPVVTTNYDQVLENSFAAQGNEFDSVVTGRQIARSTTILLQNQHCLVKLHGDCEDWDDRVLTIREYRDQYGAERAEQADLNLPLPLFLYLLASTRCVLFVGANLTGDWPLAMLKRSTNMIGWLNHFAIVPGPRDLKKRAERQRFLNEHGIQPLWFEEGRYDQIATILNSLTIKPSPKSDLAKEYAAAMRNPELITTQTRSTHPLLTDVVDSRIAKTESGVPILAPWSPALEKWAINATQSQINNRITFQRGKRRQTWRTIFLLAALATIGMLFFLAMFCLTTSAGHPTDWVQTDLSTYLYPLVISTLLLAISGLGYARHTPRQEWITRLPFIFTCRRFRGKKKSAETRATAKAFAVCYLLIAPGILGLILSSILTKNITKGRSAINEYAAKDPSTKPLGFDLNLEEWKEGSTLTHDQAIKGGGNAEYNSRREWLNQRKQYPFLEQVQQSSNLSLVLLTIGVSTIILMVSGVPAPKRPALVILPRTSAENDDAVVEILPDSDERYRPPN